MRRLMILAFTFVAFHDVNCETSQTTAKPIKGNVETTYHPHQFYVSNVAGGGAVPQYQAKDLFYYNKDLLTANQGQVPAHLNKQTPSTTTTVLYRDDSNHRGPILSHYQTILPQPDYNIQTVAAASHVPYTTNRHGFLILSPVNQHAGYYQPTNQYSVAQPFVESSIRQPQVASGPVQFYNAPAYTQYHLPVQHQTQQHPVTYQKLVQPNQQTPKHTNPSSKIEPLETRKHILPPSNLQFNTPPLFHHQVYHPLHTSVRQPQQIQPYRAGPPTPPRIYKVFTPMLPKKVIPVTEHPVQNQQAEEEEEGNDDKAEVNEEDEEEDNEKENEKIEEDDENSNIKEDDDDEDDYRPSFGFSGKFRHHDDDEDEDDRYSRYRHEDDDDHDSADTKETKKNIKPKINYTKYKFPEKFASLPTFNPSFYEQNNGRTGPAFHKPKIEVKMYKYTRSSNEPEKIQGKGSELKPVIQHNQKTYQSKWIISTKTSSSTN